MNLTQHLYRHSVFVLALIPLFAIWGFWFSYLTRPRGTLTPYDHVHGAAMAGWCLLLIGQAWLMRTGRPGWHRLFGQVSYAWVPLIVGSTLALAHYRLAERGLTEEGRYTLALQLLLLLQFVAVYALAIRRRQPRDRHARYMICTALPLLDPIFARILLVHFPGVEFSSGAIQYATFALTDAVLVWLLLWDRRGNRRADVFLPMLAFFLVTQLPVFLVLDSPAWTAFAAWFLRLPLS